MGEGGVGGLLEMGTRHGAVRLWGGPQYECVQGRSVEGRSSGATTKNPYRSLGGLQGTCSCTGKEIWGGGGRSYRLTEAGKLSQIIEGESCRLLP